MLPLLPIGVALAAATALVKNILDKSDRKSHHTILLGRVRSLDIPVDLDGKFNPNTILPDGQPLLFNVLSEPVLLRSLLDCGANPNVCNAAGVPAIIGAQRLYNSDEVVPILLKYGANPNAMDSEGRTAIFHTQSHLILRWLKEAGADMDAVDIHGKTAIINNVIKMAINEVIKQSLTETVLSLIRLGADINAKDTDGKTAIFYTDDVTTIALLVSNGADIEAIDNYGEKCKCYQSYIKYMINSTPLTPLTTELVKAVDNNNIESARRCLKNGANPNQWDRTINDWSMVHLAVYNKSPEMIELLFKYGADINANRDGIPPLSKAVYDKNMPCFKKLLELGANIKLAEIAIEYSGTSEMKQLAMKYSDRNS